IAPRPAMPQGVLGPSTAPRAPSIAPRPTVQRRAPEPYTEPFGAPITGSAPVDDSSSDEAIYRNAVLEAERSAAARASAPRAASKPDAVAIGKILTETDVYIKYGLRDKALEHLRKIFELDPDNVLAYAKMRDIYLAGNDTARAAETVANIVHIHAQRGDHDALESARAELERLAPGHPLIAGNAGEWSFQAPSEEIDSIDITEDSDVFDLGADAAEVRGEPAPDQLGAWLEDDVVPATSDDDGLLAGGFDDPAYEASELAGDATGRSAVPDAAAYAEYPAFDSGPGGMFEESSAVAIVDGDIVASAIESPDERLDGADANAGLIPYESLDEQSFDAERTDTGLALPQYQTARHAARSAPEDTSDLAAALADAMQAAAAEAEGDLPEADGDLPEADGDLPEASVSSVVALEELGAAPDAASLDALDDDDAVAPAERTSIGIPVLSELEATSSSEDDDAAIEDELDEAEFLVSQGLDAEGLEVVESVLARRPDHPRALALAAQFRAASGVHALDEQALFAEGDEPMLEDPVDGAPDAEALDGGGAEPLDAGLYAGLDEDLDVPEAGAAGADDGDETPARAAASDEPEALDDDDVAALDDDDVAALDDDDDDGILARPRSSTRVDGQRAADVPGGSSLGLGELSDDELGDAIELAAETSTNEEPEDHYDHGIAYREVGRLDDAIKHFLIAAHAPSRELAALEMIGHCLFAKGDHENAIQYFWSALERGAEGGAATNLKYEIAATYEAAGDAAQALQWFLACAGDNPEHRDVADRVAALGGASDGDGASSNGDDAALAARAEDEALAAKGASKKHKISYI
ncbi:tetratricopeptide repeat protein, partial [Myxococcota bacterium]|nr:tetratricopeptide repeat protein [Myxococcota bacterium]